MALIYDPTTARWSLQNLRTGQTITYPTQNAAWASYVAHKYQLSLI